MIRMGGRTLCAATVALAVAAVHQQMDTESPARSGRIATPSPARAQALALGFEPVLADYYWIQALQVAGSRAQRAGDNRLLRDLVDLVVALDPWVDHPYRFAALWLVESAEEVRHANALLAKGIAYHPSDWRNRFYLGYNHFFYLGDDRSAAAVLEEALALEGVPDYLGALVTRLRASAGGLEAAALFLHQLVAESEDEYAKAQYGKAFDEIETERRARFLDAARAEFQRRHGRDLERAAELWEGPLRVIERPPQAHPHFPGFEWELDPASGEIVSSFYGSRYRLHLHWTDRERRRRWGIDPPAEPEGSST